MKKLHMAVLINRSLHPWHSRQTEKKKKKKERKQKQEKSFAPIQEDA